MRNTHSGRKINLGNRAIRQAAYASVESLETRMHLTASGAGLLSTSPAVFMENLGQISDPAIRYAYKGNGLNIGMTDQGMKYQFYNASGVLQFGASLVHGQTVTPVGADPAAATFSFLTGDAATTRSAVPTFSKVVYPGVYSGIDLQTYGLSNQLKYEFHVAPGADYTQIAVQYSGIQGLSIAADGSLQVNLGDQWGALKDDAPYVYQVINGKQVQVSGQFVLVNDNTYAFQITGQYDHSRELVIDPYIAWSSFIGGSNADTATSVTTDSGKNVIVGGNTLSYGWINESLFNGKRFNDSGLSDGYVEKFSPDGALAWGVFVGGEYNDTVSGVAVDTAGTVYAVGTTTGGNWAFEPATDNGVGGERYHGGKDSFVMNISSQGQYGWASFIGGTGDESGLGVSIAGSSVIITGITNSADETVPSYTLASNQTSGRWTGYSPTLNLGFNAGVSETVKGALGITEVQTLTRSVDQPVKGNWVLTYSYDLQVPGGASLKMRFGVTLPFNATAAYIEAALHGLAAAYPLPASSGGAGDLADVVVSGGPFNSYAPSQLVFTFVNGVGPDGNGDVGDLSVNVSGILVKGEVPSASGALILTAGSANIAWTNGDLPTVGTTLYLTGDGGIAGLSTHASYFVKSVDVSSGTFQLATTAGGPAIIAPVTSVTSLFAANSGEVGALRMTQGSTDLSWSDTLTLPRIGDALSITRSPGFNGLSLGGFLVGQDYFVVSVNAATQTFRLAATPGGAAIQATATNTVSLQAAHHYSDAFVASLNSTTGERLWAKYYGGAGTDTGTAVAAADGNIFITGATDSSTTIVDDWESGFISGWGTRSVYLGSGTDAYVLHLDPANGRFMGDTFLNANENGTSAAGTAIAMDPYGNPVVTGTTRISELWRRDPTGVNGTYTGPTTRANSEVFVASFSNALVFAKWGTLIRATGSDVLPGGVAVDGDGTVLIGGATQATTLQTFKTDGQPTGLPLLSDVTFTNGAAAGSNGFVVKLDRRTQPVWGFFVGGGGSDSVNAVAIDTDHNALVAGTTDTSGGDWANSRFLNANAGNGDGFVSKLSIDSTAPTFTVAALPSVTPDTAADATYTFTVTYTASQYGLVDRQSVLDSKVTVMRSGMLIGTATVTSTTTSTGLADDARSITATYSFAAPAGGWSSTDGGTCTLSLQGGQIRNVDGYVLGTSDTSIALGSFTVNLSRPTATITANSVSNLSAASTTFTVLYDGQAAPITSYPTTLDVTGPSTSASMQASVLSETVNGNKTTVVYTAPKPAAGWKQGAKYTINVVAGAVYSDSNPNTVAATANFYVDSKVPTISFKSIGSTASSFAVVYNGTGTGIATTQGFPTRLVLTLSGTTTTFDAVATLPPPPASGTATTVTYTFNRGLLSSTSHKYTITVPAGTVRDLAGNTNPKAASKSVSLKGLGAAGKLLSPAPASVSPFCNLPLTSVAVPLHISNPLLVTGTSLLA